MSSGLGADPVGTTPGTGRASSSSPETPSAPVPFPAHKAVMR
ncbi:hypothetical protein PS9374_02445 [Planomonospora sphaerica]|jgi:hypothetical protein|uniref:Uncharacterized protein n=1 Tax=Planomonospora sphaerica TaxID=161355 RepID=A0A161MAN2_9ACTN|nr:hypothetical protein PS9374_02445 [Planomonospora sphaerica]